MQIEGFRKLITVAADVGLEQEQKHQFGQLLELGFEENAAETKFDSESDSDSDSDSIQVFLSSQGNTVKTRKAEFNESRRFVDSAACLEHAYLLAQNYHHAYLLSHIISMCSHDVRRPFASSLSVLRLILDSGMDMPAAQKDEFLSTLLRDSEDQIESVDLVVQCGKILRPVAARGALRSVEANELAIMLGNKFALQKELGTGNFQFRIADPLEFERTLESLLAKILRLKTSDGPVSIAIDAPGELLVIRGLDLESGLAFPGKNRRGRERSDQLALAIDATVLHRLGIVAQYSVTQPGHLEIFARSRAF